MNNHRNSITMPSFSHASGEYARARLSFKLKPTIENLEKLYVAQRMFEKVAPKCAILKRS